MKYIALEMPTIEALNDKVKEMIKKGWRPIGGVSISLSESDDYQYFVCSQALIRDREVVYPGALQRERRRRTSRATACCYNPMEKPMSNVENIIEGIEQADENEIMEYDFEPCFRLMREMEEAMTTFVKRVEAGEVRSEYTYAQFKAILGL